MYNLKHITVLVANEMGSNFSSKWFSQLGVSAGRIPAPIHHLADSTRTVRVSHFLTLTRPAYQRVPDYRVPAEIGSGQRVSAPPYLSFNFF